jgi:hypothetical protein
MNFRLAAFNSTRARTMDAAAGGARRLPAAHSPSMLNGDRDGKMQGTRHRCGQINAAHKRKTPPPEGDGVLDF